MVGEGTPFAMALLGPVTVAVHLQVVNVMGNSIEESPDESFVTEDLRPFFEGRLLFTNVDARS